MLTHRNEKMDANGAIFEYFCFKRNDAMVRKMIKERLVMEEDLPPRYVFYKLHQMVRSVDVDVDEEDTIRFKHI